MLPAGSSKQQQIGRFVLRIPNFREAGNALSFNDVDLTIISRYWDKHNNPPVKSQTRRKVLEEPKGVNRG